MSRISGLPGRGVVTLVVVLAVALGAAVLDRNASEPVTTASVNAASANPVDGPTIPGAQAISTAWYCAEGTSTADGRATETIIVGNLARHPIDVTVTVMSDGKSAPPSQDFRVDILAQRRIDVASVAGQVAEPGVIVEVRGGPAVVEHELHGSGDVAVGPCAREPSRSWYFPDGTTVRGAEEWLTLFNPFGDDAIVALSFLTDAGFQAPNALQSVVVPRRSRISIPVHQQVIRRDRVATSVVARTGRVIAEETLRFDGTGADGRKGLAVMLGVTGPAPRWRFAFGDSRAGIAESIAIANFAAIPTEVSVGIRLDSHLALEPQTVMVPARSVIRVDVGGRAPVGAGYSVEVRATRATPVTVSAFVSWSAGGITGVASTSGSTSASKRWAFAAAQLDQTDAVLSVVNVSVRPITVELYSYNAGDPNSPKSGPAVAVPVGERRTFTMAQLGLPPGRVTVLAADGFFVAERTIIGTKASGGGVSWSPGVPGLPLAPSSSGLSSSPTTSTLPTGIGSSTSTSTGASTSSSTASSSSSTTTTTTK